MLLAFRRRSVRDNLDIIPDVDISLSAFVPEQFALYQTDYLLTHPICPFDPVEARRRLGTRQEVLAIDIGGDKLRSAIYAIRDGTLDKRDEQVLRSKGGAEYLPVLERLAHEAEARDLRVGISSATKMEGSVITRTVNLPVFLAEFQDRYGADYTRLFGHRAFVANDTIMGICGASMRLALRGVDARHVAFVICASGVGASVIAAGTVIHVEAAHVPVVPALNPLGQTTPCGVEGREFVCVECVAAARRGIEDLYRQRTGEAKDGITLGAMYEAGDRLVTLLYETSARALAHAIAGVMARYAFPDSEESVVVLHGGNFEIGRYRDQVQHDLAALPHGRAQVVFSRDLSPNVCLDGAAVMAVCGEGVTGPQDRAGMESEESTPRGT
jgi:predicted NBD/HSP70 family sugar kinase